VLDVVAPDGYAGPIHLLVAIAADGSVLGVRVTAHKETPGLGDPIDVRKSDWITRFTGRSLANPASDRWAVKRDGGDFDQFASATITPRAVIAAVERTLQLVRRHGDALYATPAGQRLSLTDAPEKVPTP
jgi:Na+-translocating ferredoxin:NAD+ oxidoreductase subunit G